MAIEKVSTQGGKYTIVYNTETTEMYVERYGDKWRDINLGDNFMFQVFVDLQRFQELLNNLDKALEDYQNFRG